jgi:hypothetical protein
LEPCIIDKIEDMLDKKLFSINRIQASENQNHHQNSSDEKLLETFKSAMDLNQGTIGKLLQSKDNENNSIIQHFKDTQKDLIEHVMESEKCLKVTMHQAAQAAAASSDRALFRRYLFLFCLCFVLLFFTTVILTVIFGQVDALMALVM